MRFHKINSLTGGDFNSFYLPKLMADLVVLLGPEGVDWTIKTGGHYIEIRDLTDDGSIEAQKAAILTVIQDHDGVRDWSQYKPKIYQPLEFFDQFTRPQWAAIKAAARTDENVEWLLDRMRLVKEIDTSAQSVIDGLAYLVSEGLIAQSDMDRIITG